MSCLMSHEVKNLVFMVFRHGSDTSWPVLYVQVTEKGLQVTNFGFTKVRVYTILPFFVK